VRGGAGWGWTVLLAVTPGNNGIYFVDDDSNALRWFH
jgi:hypothetical protein